MSENDYDIIIVGGGPAGSAAALYGAKEGLKILIVEKERFPRDKICGDAISGKSIENMELLGILDNVKKLPSVTLEHITFGSPSGKHITIPLSKNSTRPAGFVIQRKHFDHFLFEQVKTSGVEYHENTKVTGLLIESNQVRGVRVLDNTNGKSFDIRGKLVFGADGYNSLVARKTGYYAHDPKHWVVALRCYYANVKELSQRLEIYYSDIIQPGYFWIFPLPGNMANVGVGMLHKTLKRKNIDLREGLKKLVESPEFMDRFADATPLEKPVGWNLPVASKRRKSFGNGFLLLGDAAGLIDPFTGEGIGNAFTSAKHAIRTSRKAIAENRLDSGFLSEYEEALWDEIGNELQVSTRLQKVGRYEFLLNFVINKASRNQNVRDIISGMMSNQIPKKQLTNPFFYVKLLFA